MVNFVKTGAWNLTKQEHAKNNTELAFSEK